MTDHPENTQTPGLLKKSQVNYQTSRGPTVDSVAALLLRQALKALQPERKIDPDQTMIGTPQWRVRDGTLVAMPTQFESLTQALVRARSSMVPPSSYALKASVFAPACSRIDSPDRRTCSGCWTTTRSVSSATNKDESRQKSAGIISRSTRC